MKKIIILLLLLFSGNTLLGSPEASSHDDQPVANSTTYRRQALKFFNAAPRTPLPQHKYILLLSARVQVQKGLNCLSPDEDRAQFIFNGILKRFSLAEQEVQLSVVTKRTISEEYIRMLRHQTMQDALKEQEVDGLAEQLRLL